jgi:hypothetical protein
MQNMNPHEMERKMMTQYLLACVQERDNVIMRWARETIDRDLIAQNSADDFQS